MQPFTQLMSAPAVILDAHISIEKGFAKQKYKQDIAAAYWLVKEADLMFTALFSSNLQSHK